MWALDQNCVFVMLGVHETNIFAQMEKFLFNRWRCSMHNLSTEKCKKPVVKSRKESHRHCQLELDCQFAGWSFNVFIKYLDYCGTWLFHVNSMASQWEFDSCQSMGSTLTKCDHSTLVKQMLWNSLPLFTGYMRMWPLLGKCSAHHSMLFLL